MRTRCLLVMLPAWLILAGCAATNGTKSPPKEENPHPVTLRMYVASTEKQPDYVPATDENGRPLYVAPKPFLTEREVWNALVFSGARGSLLRLEFTPIGAAALERATRDHLRSRLAIYINDELVVSPIISSRVSGGKADVNAGFSAQRAEELAKSFNSQRKVFRPLDQKPDHD